MPSAEKLWSADSAPALLLAWAEGLFVSFPLFATGARHARQETIDLDQASIASLRASEGHDCERATVGSETIPKRSA